MSTHYVSIDEQIDPDYAARAFCACGWAGDVWHHADEAPAWWNGVLAAFDAAEADGAEHLADEADDPAVDPPDPARFRGLRVPPVGRDGFAEPEAAL